MADVLWYPSDGTSDQVQVRVRQSFDGAKVALWAGDELDPAYLSPAAARELADELPGLLRRFADEADAMNNNAVPASGA